MPKNPHANFTPVLDGYSGIGAFRFWCQTALPLTYDDSLSYYELLNKVVNYLNHTIDDLTAVENNTSALAEAYEKLQKYVNDYFDDLDVEAELRNALDAMVEDGTMDELLSAIVENQLPGVVDEKIDGVVAGQIDNAVAGQIDESVADQLPSVVAEGIPSEVTGWLEENVDPVGSAVVVDSSLTISGAAADAKVTGDAIRQLNSDFIGITDIAKKLNGSDSDIGFTSIDTYEQIGTTGVYAKITDDELSLYGTASANRWFCCFNGQDFVANTSTSFNKTLDAGVYQFEINTNNDEVDHTVWYTESTFNNTYTPRAYDGDIISASNPIMLGIRLANGRNYGTIENPTTYTIKIKNYTEKADKSEVEEINDSVDTNTGNIANNKFDINGLNHSIYGYRAITPEWESGAYRNTDGTKNNDSNILRTYIRTVNLIDYDENYIISLLNNLPINVRVRLQFYQSDGTFISGISEFQYSAFRVKDFAPANTGKFAISATSSAHGSETGDINPAYGDTIYITKNNEALIREILNILNDPEYFNHSFDGAKLSLLGDSISAISGYSTSGHNYYPNPNSDVSDVSEMWWKILADSMGMTPLVIGAWSGSCVTSGLRDANSYVPASNPSRCESLHSGTTMPDVVLIAMGVNDFSYATPNSLGTWDGTTALGSQSDLSDYDTSTFKTAYATMLARIQHKYPQAFIICITPWFVCRYETNTGANYLNDIGKSIADYADAVREIANIMHCAVIDGTNIGFNRYNYYPTYAQDSSVKPTHPNIAGQKQIADAITRQIKNIHKIS